MGAEPVGRRWFSAAGPMLAVVIMCVGSVGLWLGVPLLWLWAGSQVEGLTQSLALGFAVALGCAILMVVLLARLMLVISNAYRASRVARGLDDKGHDLLEHVLIISAGFCIAVFMVWFFLFAGADPVPLGINI